jgi:hypothetical protein
LPFLKKATPKSLISHLTSFGTMLTTIFAF